jgi:hypothetical protein
MSRRFRLLLIGLGALIVVATYSFPLWYPLVSSRGEVVPFPEIDPTLYDVFNALPIDRQRDYLAVRGTNLLLAVDMANTALSPDVVVPVDDQTPPNITGQEEVASGEFTAITPNRAAEGTVTIYQLPDGSRYLWLSDFRAIKAPDMRVVLSTHSTLSLEDLGEGEELALSRDDILLGRLTANVGSQPFDVPSENDLALYSSIILYSQELGLVYSIADI